MITRLDSAYPPSPATAQAAAAAGIRGWDGYISTAPYDGGSHFWLWHPWPREGFEAARLCGSMPIAYCSGYDDPLALRKLAASWNVRLCLDVENGIRGDGGWVQSFLDASGAGLYGNHGVHPGRNAAFHIMAAYLGYGDPGDTWWTGGAPRPGGPCGWQWLGTHTEFGCSVDRGNFDDWFLSAPLYGGSTSSLGGFLMALSDADQAWVKAAIGDNHEALARLEKMLGSARRNPDGSYSVLPDDQLPNYLGFVNNEVRLEQSTVQAIKAELDAAKAELDNLARVAPVGVDMAPVVKAIAALQATSSKIEGALVKSGGDLAQA